MTLTRIFLLTLIASLSLAALVGIVNILTASNPSWRVIGSMLSIGLFSLTAMACAYVLSRKTWQPAMVGGLILSALGLVAYLAEIWGELLTTGRGFRGGYELMLILATWNVAVAVIGLIALTRFDNALRRVREATIGLLVISASLISLIVVSDLNNETTGRLLACSLILTTLGVIVTPVLYWIAGDKVRPAAETTRLELDVKCPRCLTDQTLPRGESRCRECRLKFTIDVEEPRCPACGYLLYRLTEPRCPECGTTLASGEVKGSGVVG